MIQDEFAPPDTDQLDREAAELGLPPSGAGATGDDAWATLADWSAALMGIDGVVMVGLGSTGTGDRAILVGVRRADQLGNLPAELDGLPVHGQVIGDVDALSAPGG